MNNVESDDQLNRNTPSMTIKLQDLGNMGENYVRKFISFPKCKRQTKTLRAHEIVDKELLVA
jgi:hypothetical protein